MIKKISYIFYYIIKIIDKLFYFFFKKKIIYWIKEFIEKDSYKSINILEKKINFFIPTNLVNWRVQTFYSKEPETIEWINNFENKENLIFWDIGANIGLFSIYAALRYNNCKVISFEPSTNNLRILSRNIYINNLHEKIKIFTNPLSEHQNLFLKMNESFFTEGGALNTFGEKYDFEGKDFIPNNQYQLLGSSIDFLLENKILDIPDYIKIDVDGIEHLILKGGKNYLKNQKIKSLSIEINENFIEQFEGVKNIMSKCNFEIKEKKNNINIQNNKFSNTYNYIFSR